MTNETNNNNDNFKYNLTHNQKTAIMSQIRIANLDKEDKFLSVWFNEDGTVIGMIESTKGCMVRTLENVRAVPFRTVEEFLAEVA